MKFLLLGMNHWPSQGNEDVVRLQVAQQVREVISQLQAQYGSNRLCRKSAGHG
ncbi:MAG: hypothetical protein R2827_15250 [Bdellovibrionales bacterium]